MKQNSYRIHYNNYRLKTGNNFEIMAKIKVY
jgi:hypothetical protein